ncbi:MAG: TerB family tellurite resistance protein [Chloroflexaceae bacterium]|nr:TerB family tellurite resistance protein [Chloroflexaceae bacterium]
MKILIGAAWLDGVIQSEERRYLHEMSVAHHLEGDAEIKSLLSEIKPVKPIECYQWIEEYLDGHHSVEDYRSLLEAISGLVYSDGNIDIREAQLLTHLQGLDPTQESPKTLADKLLKAIQKLYKQGMKSPN